MRFAHAATAVLITALIPAPRANAQGSALSADEAKQIATGAYIYGYPLVTMEYTRRSFTNVAKPEGTRAPMGQLIRMREYPTAKFRAVTAPNADTLYVSGFVDVGQEPYILSLPDAHDRYYLFPMLDAWTNVFQVPGKRTTGTKAQTYAVTGPGWSGTLPANVKEYKSPTSLVWMLGRIYCTGTPEDYQAVHKMEDEISLVPLSAYGKPYTPPPGKVDSSYDAKTPPREQVNALDAAAYFNLMATLMKDNPPAASDAPIINEMARLGIEPGKPFDLAKLAPEVQAAIKDVPKEAVAKILEHFKRAGALVNGWTFTTKAGVYGDDYLQRAFITYIGLGANRPQDAVYPTSESDAEGKPYSGANKYVMHFEKGHLPPVNGFWSLTMYDAGYFFVENPLNRYTLSQRNQLKPNADGSVDLYIQRENPGPEKEANWLPAPLVKFNLMVRLYWPKETPPSILDGAWKPPAVKRAG
jgi:hypothetical protein